MTVSPLKYLSEKKLFELKESIVANRDRYEAGDFLDLEHDNGWAAETSTVQVDLDLMGALDGTARTAAADIDNSLILYQSLKGMTPALAREERIWARLTHIECLEYSRARWLLGNVGQELDKQVELHMFANRLIGIQRNNALSRLWWNMHVAKIADPLRLTHLWSTVLPEPKLIWRSRLLDATNFPALYLAHEETRSLARPCYSLSLGFRVPEAYGARPRSASQEMAARRFQPGHTAVCGCRETSSRRETSAAGPPRAPSGCGTGSDRDE